MVTNVSKLLQFVAARAGKWHARCQQRVRCCGEDDVAMPFHVDWKVTCGTRRAHSSRTLELRIEFAHLIIASVQHIGRICDVTVRAANEEGGGQRATGEAVQLVACSTRACSRPNRQMPAPSTRGRLESLWSHGCDASPSFLHGWETGTETGQQALVWYCVSEPVLL